MRDRVTFEAVGATLHDDEFGPGALDERLDYRPGVGEFIVSGARRQWNIQLRPRGETFAGFTCRAGARIQESTIFMDIGEQQIRVVLEPVKHTISVMRIDIHVGNALQIVMVSKVFDGNPAVVEDTKSGSMVAPGMMQTGNWNESPLRVTLHYGIDGSQRRTNHVRCNLEDAGKCRGITAIEKSTSFRRFLRHKIDVLGRMKQRELVNAGSSRYGVLNGVTETGPCEFIVEHFVAIGAERVTVTETVASKLLAPEHPN